MEVEYLNNGGSYYFMSVRPVYAESLIAGVFNLLLSGPFYSACACAKILQNWLLNKQNCSASEDLPRPPFSGALLCPPSLPPGSYKVSYIKYRNVQESKAAHTNNKQRKQSSERRKRDSAVRCSTQTQLNCQSRSQQSHTIR